MFELSLLLISVIKSVPERSLPVASVSMLGVSVCEGVSSSSLCFFHCSLLFSWVCINWSWIGFPHTAVRLLLFISTAYMCLLSTNGSCDGTTTKHNETEEEEEEEQEDPVCKGMSTFWGSTLKLSITIWYWHWYRYINIWIDPGSVGCFRCNGRGGARDNTCREQVRTGSHGLLPW